MKFGDLICITVHTDEEINSAETDFRLMSCGLLTSMNCRQLLRCCPEGNMIELINVYMVECAWQTEWLTSRDRAPYCDLCGRDCTSCTAYSIENMCSVVPASDHQISYYHYQHVGHQN